MPDAAAGHNVTLESIPARRLRFLVAQFPGAIAEHPRCGCLALTGPLCAQAHGAAAHPRTPWGDPDLQGHYTNKYEYGTPFERPAGFEGRRPTDLTKAGAGPVDGQAPAGSARPRAVSRRRPERADRQLRRVPRHLRGDPRQPGRGSSSIRPTAGFRRSCRRPRRGRRRPRRAAASATAPSTDPRTSACGSAASRAACPGSMVPGVYGNSYQIVQAPGFVAIRYEMVHDTRIIPLEPRAPVPAAMRSDFGRRARALGGRHAGGGDHELPAAQRVSQRRRRARCGSWSGSGERAPIRSSGR